MNFYPVFLSVVCVVRNQGPQLNGIIRDASEKLPALVSDYELILVDNASDDESVNVLKSLTEQSGYPNLQIYSLTKEVDGDTASWVGLENALGDFIAVIDPLLDDISFLPEMLDKAVMGADVVFANNQQKPRQSFAYRAAYAVFNFLYKSFNGIHLAKEAPQYRLLSKRVVNFILQHPQPAVTYRTCRQLVVLRVSTWSTAANHLQGTPKNWGKALIEGCASSFRQHKHQCDL